MQKKTIIALMRPDTVEPYKRMGHSIPVVHTSDHPRFKPGTRFDYGFISVALQEGYMVVLVP